MQACPRKEPRLRAESGFIGREDRAETKPGKARERSGGNGGATCGCARSGLPHPYSAFQRLDREPCARCAQARPQAPAPVKPCPGGQRSEQGFSGSPGIAPQPGKSIKETKKDFKEMFLWDQ